MASDLGCEFTAEGVEKVANKLKSNGIYEQFKNMPYGEWEKVAPKIKKRGRPRKIGNEYISKEQPKNSSKMTSRQLLKEILLLDSIEQEETRLKEENKILKKFIVGLLKETEN